MQYISKWTHVNNIHYYVYVRIYIIFVIHMFTVSLNCACLWPSGLMAAGQAKTVEAKTFWCKSLLTHFFGEHL